MYVYLHGKHEDVGTNAETDSDWACSVYIRAPSYHDEALKLITASGHLYVPTLVLVDLQRGQCYPTKTLGQIKQQKRSELLKLKKGPLTKRKIVQKKILCSGYCNWFWFCGSNGGKFIHTVFFTFPKVPSKIKQSNWDLLFFLLKHDLS